VRGRVPVVGRKSCTCRVCVVCVSRHSRHCHFSWKHLVSKLRPSPHWLPRTWVHCLTSHGTNTLHVLRGLSFVRRLVSHNCWEPANELADGPKDPEPKTWTTAHTRKTLETIPSKSAESVECKSHEERKRDVVATAASIDDSLKTKVFIDDSLKTKVSIDDSLDTGVSIDDSLETGVKESKCVDHGERGGIKVDMEGGRNTMFAQVLRSGVLDRLRVLKCREPEYSMFRMPICVYCRNASRV
jgi:hypothetical protein